MIGLLLCCAAAVALGVLAGVDHSQGFWPEPIAIGGGVAALTLQTLLLRRGKDPFRLLTRLDDKVYKSRLGRHVPGYRRWRSLTDRPKR